MPLPCTVEAQYHISWPDGKYSIVSGKRIVEDLSTIAIGDNCTVGWSRGKTFEGVVTKIGN
jgi:hypothetical protein